MGSKYQEAIDMLESRGVTVTESKQRLGGIKIKGEYRFGSKVVLIRLDYGSFSHGLSVDMTIPISREDDELKDEYDRIFPEEKNKWGRSSPSLRQSVIDFMRGQTSGDKLVELLDGGKALHLCFGLNDAKRGVDGLCACIHKVSLELRKGNLHEDILIHLFAY